MSTWSPRDFLLRGDFCPAEVLPVALNEMRYAFGASGALLLVAGARGLLRTLCSCTADGAAGATVTGFLRSGPKIRVTQGKRLRPRRNPGEAQLSAAAIITGIASAARGAGREEVQEALGPVDSWVPAWVPDEMDAMTLAVAVFMREPAEGFVSLREGSPVVPCDEYLLDIAAMASSTANASVHRDAAVMARVDEKLDPDDDSREAAGEIPEATRLLVELAAEVSHSDVAAYYVNDPIAKELRLAAAHPPDPSLHGFPRSLPYSGGSVVAVSAQRRRPVVHGWVGSPKGLACTRTAAGEAREIEMATPVPGPLASARAPCVGVLSVSRISESEHDPRAYGAYDHALLRNVALRLAVLRATEDMEAAADMFRDLTIRGSRNSFAQLAKTELRRVGYESAAVPQEAGLPGPVPDDVAVAIPSITAALREVAILTGSHSATFRAALPDRLAQARHGLSLQRVAAYPSERMHDERAVQQLNESAVNCRAACSGSAQNVPDVTVDPGFQWVREGTLSAISVPVALEGMVVGIVNLESPVDRNYDARVSTVIAFAEHVGTVLANARLALARELHQYATQIVTRAHDLSAQTTIILDATKVLERSERARVERAVKDIEERARGIRDFAIDQGSEMRADLPTLAGEALTSAGLQNVKQEISRATVWESFPPESAEVVLDCLRHVFANVQNQLPVQPAGRPSIEIAKTRWGGRSYDVLQVRNEASRPPGAARAANAYRVPILDRHWRSSTLIDGTPISLPRFGAYLAGNQARLLGGDVHLALEGPRFVRVTVMLPEPSAGGRDA
jgi:hypothetical protein